MDSKTQAPDNFNSLWATGGGIKITIIDIMHYAELHLNNNNPIVSESHKTLYEGRNPLKTVFCVEGMIKTTSNSK